jgi:hypothetical protein
MPRNGLISVKGLLDGGFFYANLSKMGQCCREETDPDRLVISYVLGCILFDLSEVVEANPKENVIKGLEAEYKPIIRSLLDMVISGAPLQDQIKILTLLIQTNWNIGH